jgi:hypothetical protein
VWSFCHPAVGDQLLAWKDHFAALHAAAGELRARISPGPGAATGSNLCHPAAGETFEFTVRDPRDPLEPGVGGPAAGPKICGPGARATWCHGACGVCPDSPMRAKSAAESSALAKLWLIQFQYNLKSQPLDSRIDSFEMLRFISSRQYQW